MYTTSSKRTLSTTLLLALATLPLSTFADTAPILGKWHINQEGENATVVIQSTSNGYVGKIVQGKKYVGKTIITGLKEEEQGKYTGGTIIDPTNGKHYSLNAEVEGNVLNLRGYVGTPLLGSTQTWYR